MAGRAAFAGRIRYGLRGDMNLDGRIDMDESWARWSRAFVTSARTRPSMKSPALAGDMDDDGDLDFDDLGEFASSPTLKSLRRSRAGGARMTSRLDRGFGLIPIADKNSPRLVW